MGPTDFVLYRNVINLQYTILGSSLFQNINIALFAFLEMHSS